MTEYNPEFETELSNITNVKVARAIGLDPHRGSSDGFWGVGVGYFLPEEKHTWYARYKPEQFGFNLMLGSRGIDHECDYPIPDFYHKAKAAIAALHVMLKSKDILFSLNFGNGKWSATWKHHFNHVWHESEFYDDLSQAICESILGMANE